MIWHASWVLVQNAMHDPAPETCPRDKVGSVTSTLDGKLWTMHDDWQSANCPLQLPMQLVVVEVRGVGSPVRGGVTFGTVDCADAASATKEIAAADISIASARMTPPSD